MKMLEQRQYEDLVDMFASDGWKFFYKSAEDLEEALTKGAADSAVTNEQWQYLRGQLGQLRSILGYETFITSVWQQKLEDDKVKPEAEVNVDLI